MAEEIKEVKKELIEKKQELIETQKELKRTIKENIFLSKAKASALKFHNEFNKSTKTAMVAAFGFLIALAWRDLISEFVNTLTSISPVKGRLISAIIVTLISVIGIIIVTGLLPHKD